MRRETDHRLFLNLLELGYVFRHRAAVLCARTRVFSAAAHVLAFCKLVGQICFFLVDFFRQLVVPILCEKVVLGAVDVAAHRLAVLVTAENSHHRLRHAAGAVVPRQNVQDLKLHFQDRWLSIEECEGVIVYKLLC